MEGPSQELDDEARRALDLINERGTVSVSELRDAGVSMPGQALYALQLAGWPVRRTGSSWRLVDGSDPAVVRPAPVPRVRRTPREP